MSETATKPEPYFSAKELVHEFKDRNIPCDIFTARELIKAMRESGGGVILRRYVRMSDIISWSKSNPDWSPYVKAGKTGAGVLCVGP